MVKSIPITKNVILNFYFVKSSPYLKDKLTYGSYITHTRHINFTSTSFFINFGKGLIRIELKKIKNGNISKNKGTSNINGI